MNMGERVVEVGSVVWFWFLFIVIGFVFEFWECGGECGVGFRVVNSFVVVCCCEYFLFYE